MENKTAEKAKKGALSIVFSRTALILLLVVVQFLLMLGIATYLRDYVVYVYSAMNILGAVIVIYIINQRGNPAFNMTWVLLILIFPVFGCLFYLYVKSQLGTRYIGKRLGRLKLDTWQYMEQKQEIIDDLRLSKPANANLAHYMKHQLGFPTYRNTKATYFACGEEKFTVLLERLEKAEKFIFLEYFIVEEGYMWDSILDILKRKVQEGVEVRFMYDGMCSISLLPYNYPKTIRKYGIQCKMFSPIRPVLSTTQNNRDHRKICVIDGKIGFTGGINLGDEYINRKVRFGYWKDTAVMLEGDAVQSLTMLFLQMWNVTELKPDQYKRYVTPMSAELHRELGFMIPYGDSPYDNEDVGEEVYFHILNHAKKYVHIMTPYLILDNEMLDTLTRAAKSGIEVCIIMPHIPDKWYVHLITQSTYPSLVQAGVKIYEYTPGFVHGKSFVVDDKMAIVGTVNMDYRSYYLHYECGVWFYRSKVVMDVKRDYLETLSNSHQVTLEECR